MKFFVHIATLLLLAATLSCRPLPKAEPAEEAVAVVGQRHLDIEELRAALPQGIHGDDSVSYADAYISKWMVQQLKLNEAERLFCSSYDDVERLVEEYRRSLLIRKLEQHYIESASSDSVSMADIKAYYNAHQGDFRLSSPMVKGVIITLPERFRGRDKMVKKMASKSGEQQRELEQMCKKNNFAYSRFDEWADFAEFLSRLPLTRSSANTSLLAKRNVQQIRYNRSIYCYIITAALKAGEIMPMYMVEDDIRRILVNRRRMEILRQHEERLVQEALSSGRARLNE